MSEGEAKQKVARILMFKEHTVAHLVEALAISRKIVRLIPIEGNGFFN
jgi:hypothetical protein